MLLLCPGFGPNSILAQSQTHTGVLMLDLGPDTSICFDQAFYLSIPKRNGFSYQWENGYNGTERPVSKPGTYWVTATSEDLILSDTILIGDANCECVVFMPNVFSPNCDGYNDVIIPQTTCPVSEYKLSIYNRWGSRLWETEDLGKGWYAEHQGKPVPIGVYYWTLHYKTPNGKIVDRVGHLTVIR